MATWQAWHPSEDELTRTLSAVQIILDGQPHGLGTRTVDLLRTVPDDGWRDGTS